AVLLIGENSTVLFDAGKVELIAGTGTSYMQYISGSNTVTVTVPGGIITLNGTDIDVVNNDATKITTVRSRDGGIEVNANPTGASITNAESPNKVIIINYGASPTVSTSTPNDSPLPNGYDVHDSNIYTQISVPSNPAPVNVVKANAYIIKNPEVLNNTLNVGEKILIKLTYSKPVVVNAPNPQIAFTLGLANKTAIYESGSGTNELIFSYITGSGDGTTTAGVSLIIQASSSGLTNQDKIISSDVGGNRAISTYKETGAINMTINTTVPSAPTGATAVAGNTQA
ncbi:MAG: hypothetical protein ACK53L_07050, partial [Pirellulaceae bacterium]